MTAQHCETCGDPGRWIPGAPGFWAHTRQPADSHRFVGGGPVTGRPRFACARCGRAVAATADRPEQGTTGPSTEPGTTETATTEETTP